MTNKIINWVSKIIGGTGAGAYGTAKLMNAINKNKNNKNNNKGGKNEEYNETNQENVEEMIGKIPEANALEILINNNKNPLQKGLDMVFNNYSKGKNKSKIAQAGALTTMLLNIYRVLNLI